MDTIVINKYKTGNWIYLGIAFVLFLFFTILATFGMLNHKRFELKELIIVISFASLATLIFVYNFRKYWRKLSSKNPEFELNESKLVIYDNPRYSSIKFNDIEEIEILKHHKTAFLGIGLNSQTNHISNLAYLRTTLPKVNNQSLKWVLLDLTFVGMKPEELKNILEAKVTSANN